MSIYKSNKKGEPIEKNIEKAICDYLDGLGAYVWNVELSGKPVKTPKGIILTPFKGKYYRRGASDILCFWEVRGAPRRHFS